MKIRNYSIILLFVICNIFAVGLLIPVSAFNITTDEITETSIIWNLSQKDGNISYIAVDGILLKNFFSNETRYVQNNLYGGETHILTVEDSNGNISTASATTLNPVSESDKLLTFTNVYIYVFVCLLFCVVGFFIPIAGLGSCIFAILGLAASTNNSFAMGFLLFIFLIIGIIEVLTYNK